VSRKAAERNRAAPKLEFEAECYEPNLGRRECKAAEAVSGAKLGESLSPPAIAAFSSNEFKHPSASPSSSTSTYTSSCLSTCDLNLSSQVHMTGSLCFLFFFSSFFLDLILYPSRVLNLKKETHFPKYLWQAQRGKVSCDAVVIEVVGFPFWGFPILVI
jgi:hypothetical protein